MEWQPIESAPKDGSEFLAYDSRVKKMDVCRWWEHFNKILPVQSDCEYGPDKDEFGFEWGDISHWMPLPSPPK